jgi:hypothetical protein
LIGKFGYNYSSFMSPVLFFLAALSWAFISDVQEENRAAAVGIETAALEEVERGDVDANTGYMKAVWRGARGFVRRRILKEEAVVKGDGKAVHSESFESVHAEPWPKKGDLWMNAGVTALMPVSGT